MIRKKMSLKTYLPLLMLFSLNLRTGESFSVWNNSVTIMDLNSSKRPSYDDYLENRQKLLEEHSSRALGSDVKLSIEEEHFNSILMDFKSDELVRGFDNPFNFTPSRHFFDVLKSVKSSPLFNLIRKMPKGFQSFH
jgi:uncharacterized protein (DUF1330 family)